MCIEQGIGLSWWKTVRISCAQASKILVVCFWKFGIGALVFETGMCLCVGVWFGEWLIDR